MKLTEEQYEKRLFVEGPLSAMLKEATGGAVEGMVFYAEGDDEEVLVEYHGNLFSVVVSCDSLWAIAKDVTAAVGKRFE